MKPLPLIMITTGVAMLGVCAWNAMEQITQRHTVRDTAQRIAQDSRAQEHRAIVQSIADDARAASAEQKRTAQCHAVRSLANAVRQRGMDDINGKPASVNDADFNALKAAAVAVVPEHASTINAARLVDLEELADCLLEGRSFRSLLTER